MIRVVFKPVWDYKTQNDRRNDTLIDAFFMVKNGVVDMLGDEFVLNNERSQVVDFSAPMVNLKPIAMMSSPTSLLAKEGIHVISDIFPIIVWILIITSFLAVLTVNSLRSLRAPPVFDYWAIVLQQSLF